MAAEIGHNQPPSMIDVAADVTASINEWLTDHPVILTEEEAKDAKVLIDRGKLGFKDLEDERDKQVRPLNETIAAINSRYRGPRELLKKITDELLRRTTDWIAKEQAQRIKIAEEARKKSEDAARAAREAEQRELDVVGDAKAGAIVDVARASAEADAAFSDYKRSARTAALAERNAKVKVSGGFTRSLSLRTKEVLTVADACAAIAEIGMTPDIEAAILKGARAFRTIHGQLPCGVTATEHTGHTEGT